VRDHVKTKEERVAGRERNRMGRVTGEGGRERPRVFSEKTLIF